MLDPENPAENPAQNPAQSPDDSAPGPDSTQPAGLPPTSFDPGEGDSQQADAPVKKAPAKRAAAKKTPAKKTTAKRATKKGTAAPEHTDPPAEVPAADQAPESGDPASVASEAAEPVAAAETKRTTARRTSKTATAGAAPAATMLVFQPPEPTKAPPRKSKASRASTDDTDGISQAADDQQVEEQTRQTGQINVSVDEAPAAETDAASTVRELADEPGGTDDDTSGDDTSGDDTSADGGNRRRRRRGGRRRRKPGESDSDGGDSAEDGTDRSDGSGGSKQGGRSTASEDGGTTQSRRQSTKESPAKEETGQETDKATDKATGKATGKDDVSESEESDASGGTRRRRRRRRGGDGGESSKDEPDNTGTRVRKPRAAEDEITSLTGSTRLEAKKQRRREGREAGRRRAPVVSEAEFLARREAVERVMVIRQRKDLTQIAVLEDKVLVEHYVARESQTSLIGNIYLGRVQNVLPSMEAAFIDIGKGRNAVLYAGEVNWDTLGGKNGPRKIESVLKSGQSILVQVSKDPVGHKGARLTSQISIPGRFLVYVPDGTTSGISRKLPENERGRLKTLLKQIVPDTAGVIVRTAAEGASEEELTLDVQRLTARWEEIQKKVESGNSPQLLYGEPDLTLKVVRDLFTEDFGKLVVSGDDAWKIVDEYVENVAPDLADRLENYDGDKDVFAAYRIDEQIAKGLDRKVWLPSGGSLVIDRTEAMTVVDVNTGKFTGSGGNLEETVTRNNLEAAEEIIRQLRLRDIGGIIVVDFIDMVLESNRDLVLRRMVECLGRDRTRHQVAEVTSLGLVQMTRKRIGTGLLEAFSESCEHCQGRGVIVHPEPIETRGHSEDEPRRSRRSDRSRGNETGSRSGGSPSPTPSPKDVAALARPENADRPPLDEVDGPAAASTLAETRSADVDQPDAVQPELSRATAPAIAPFEGHEDEQPEPFDDAPAADGVEPTPQRTSAQPASPVRQRKRAARRPQGPAETVSSTDTPPGVIPAPAQVPAGEPSAASDPAPDTAQEPTVTVAAPRVVTTVRRRSAARPAGPPAAVATEGDSASF